MKITIDHHSTVPLHLQLLNQLRHLILSGQWPPNSRIPSEPTLQHELNISRSTIRQALSNAEVDGLIERVPGKGTFVAQAPVQTGLSRHIGYITVDFLSNDNEYRMLCGAENAAKARGYRILFCNSNNEPAEEDSLLEQLLQDKVSGILIWPGFKPSLKLFELARQESLPLVLMDRTFPDLACDYVTSTNYAGAYSAVEYLIRLGHRQIAFLSHPMLQVLPVAERLRGYQAAMRETRLAPAEPWIIPANHELGTKYALEAYRNIASPEIEQIACYLRKFKDFTAIFAVNDLVALLATKAVRLAGLKIPNELSLVGFDDLDIVAHLETPLTTVAQDAFALGRRAAELLIERIEGYTGPPRQEMLSTQLKVRASTTSPAMVWATEKSSRVTM